MTVIIRGRDEYRGISYEISGSGPKTTLAAWEELVQLLAAGEPEIVPNAPTRALEPVPDSHPTNDVHFAEKRAEKAAANDAAGSVPENPAEDEIDADLLRMKDAMEKKNPRPAVKMAKDGAVCEDCGVGLTESEARSSKLFVSRLVCKACLQKLGA